jgi:hypothetical protein
MPLRRSSARKWTVRSEVRPGLELVVEFHEEQHSKPSPLFGRRQTVSGIKSLLIREDGLRLVVIEKSAFVVKSKRIMRDPGRDIAVVRQHHGNYANGS